MIGDASRDHRIHHHPPSHPWIHRNSRIGQHLVEHGEEVGVFAPDVVCGRCYPCTHVMGFVWCDNSECYGNSFTCAEPPHLLGGWAEFMYLRPQTFVYKVPSGLSPTVAVLAELMTCTASLDKIKEFSPYALEGFNSGDTMVVIGSGPLGLLHIAKADMMGAGQIIATDLSSYRRSWARRCGADEVLDVSVTTAEERLQRVRELTAGRGADVVLHMTTTPQSFIEGIEMLKRGGLMLSPTPVKSASMWIDISTARTSVCSASLTTRAPATDRLSTARALRRPVSIG